MLVTFGAEEREKEVREQQPQLNNFNPLSVMLVACSIPKEVNVFIFDKRFKPLSVTRGQSIDSVSNKGKPERKDFKWKSVTATHMLN